MIPSDTDTPTVAPRTTASEIGTGGERKLLLDHRITPMDAVNTLYSEGDSEFAEAILASLSAQVFDAEIPQSAGRFRRRLAGMTFRLLKRTTRARTRSGYDGRDIVAYENPILKRSGHPYAITLLGTSDAQAMTFVEGGDPMNAPYMMISPEIRQNAGSWDRILLNSMLGRDVQLRFIWEARATLEAARHLLDQGRPVRIKAAAAGTGLNLILVFDRLVREGYNPALISAEITDRDPSNVIKANRLLAKLATTGEQPASSDRNDGICAREEDLMSAEIIQARPYDIITLVGILEYFHGHTCGTMEENLNQQVIGDESEAADLVAKIGATVGHTGSLITNTYRMEPGGRILEVFGKRLRYRNRDDLHQLLATAAFHPVRNVGSGNVYDVEVLKKHPV